MERIQTITRQNADKGQLQAVCGFAGTASAIGELAEHALLQELSAYPKPGMVSYVDSGSHSDMNASTFEKSAKAIKPFFVRLAMAGFGNEKLDELRKIGLEAERAMHEATNGINTHKGAIFILGLLAAAAGKAKKKGLNLSDTGQVAAEEWGSLLLLPEEFEASTNGAAAYKRHGIKGARGEAASGFFNVYKTGLPSLRGALSATSPEDAAVHCFFALLEKVADTTLVHRGGLEGMKFAQKRANEFNRKGGVFNTDWKRLAQAIHNEFIARNLSAGGIADLLAATIFVNNLECMRKDKRWRE